MTVTDSCPAEATLRERKKAQTRTAIHEAAFRLVDERGLDGVTVEEICAEADVSPRTFFNYFPSKAAAVLGMPEQIFGDEAIARFRASDAPLVEALSELISVAFTSSGEDHRRTKELVARRPELQQSLGQWMGAARARLLQLSEERADSREDAALAVTLVLAAVSYVAHGGEEWDAPVVDRVRRVVARLGELARG